MSSVGPVAINLLPNPSERDVLNATYKACTIRYTIAMNATMIAED